VLERRWNPTVPTISKWLQKVGCPSWTRIEPCALCRGPNFSESSTTSGSRGWRRDGRAIRKPGSRKVRIRPQGRLPQRTSDRSLEAHAPPDRGDISRARSKGFLRPHRPNRPLSGKQRGGRSCYSASVVDLGGAISQTRLTLGAAGTFNSEGGAAGSPRDAGAPRQCPLSADSKKFAWRGFPVRDPFRTYTNISAGYSLSHYIDVTGRD
jgi:hypothetical protein